MPLFHASAVGSIADTSTTSSITTVASTATSSVILAANTNRKGATVNNRSTSKLYLAMSATATASAFTVPLDPDDYWEAPFKYTGIISGIWVSANGNAIVTELT